MAAPARPTGPSGDLHSSHLFKSIADTSNVAELKACFEEFDTDKSGSIELAELSKLLIVLYKNPSFGGVDVSASVEGMAKDLLKHVDDSQDGKLQFDEFVQAIKLVSGGEDN